MVQVKQELFALAGLREKHLRHQTHLENELRRFAPDDTGRLRISYTVFPIQPSKGKYVFAISNKMWYFKFAWHYYRGEIKFNNIFIRDFIEQAVSSLIERINGG